MKRILILTICCLMMQLPILSKEKKKRTTAVFQVEISCDNCVKKIQNNISFEKGVKDMFIDKKQQTVTVVFDPEKTDVTQLSNAFRRIGKPAKKVELKEAENTENKAIQTK